MPLEIAPHWPLEKIEEAYLYAYVFYEKGHYEESSQIFSLLTCVSTANPTYWMGLGASLQMLKRYEEAIDAYAAAAVLEDSDSDPFPHLHAAECFYSLKINEKALQALESAEIIAKNEPKYQKLCTQINLLKSVWRKDARSN